MKKIDIQLRAVETFKNNIFFIQDDENVVVGSFALKDNPNVGFAIKKLDEHDIELLKDTPVKVGQQIFKYQSEKMKNHPMGNNKFGYERLVKINFFTKKLHFINDNVSFDNGKYIFETKGESIHYLHIVDEEVHQMILEHYGK